MYAWIPDRCKFTQQKSPAPQQGRRPSPSRYHPDSTMEHIRRPRCVRSRARPAPTTPKLQIAYCKLSQYCSICNLQCTIYEFPGAASSGPHSAQAYVKKLSAEGSSSLCGHCAYSSRISPCLYCTDRAPACQEPERAQVSAIRLILSLDRGYS